MDSMLTVSNPTTAVSNHHCASHALQRSMITAKPHTANKPTSSCETLFHVSNTYTGMLRGAKASPLTPCNHYYAHCSHFVKNARQPGPCNS
jgi:hypothetical protein